MFSSTLRGGYSAALLTSGLPYISVHKPGFVFLYEMVKEIPDFPEVQTERDSVEGGDITGPVSSVQLVNLGPAQPWAGVHHFDLIMECCLSHPVVWFLGLDPRSANFFVKGQILSSTGFAGNMISPGTIRLHLCSVKEAVDNM